MELTVSNKSSLTILRITRWTMILSCVVFLLQTLASLHVSRVNPEGAMLMVQRLGQIGSLIYLLSCIALVFTSFSYLRTGAVMIAAGILISHLLPFAAYLSETSDIFYELYVWSGPIGSTCILAGGITIASEPLVRRSGSKFVLCYLFFMAMMIVINCANTTIFDELGGDNWKYNTLYHDSPYRLIWPIAGIASDIIALIFWASTLLLFANAESNPEAESIADEESPRGKMVNPFRIPAVVAAIVFAVIVALIYTLSIEKICHLI